MYGEFSLGHHKNFLSCCFSRRGNSTFLKVLCLGSVCVSREATLRATVCYWLFPTGKRWTESGFTNEHKPVGDTTPLSHKKFQKIIPCSATYRKQISWSLHGVMCMWKSYRHVFHPSQRNKEGNRTVRINILSVLHTI